MAVHAQVIPPIAAGIARLTNAQSASLREKLSRLTLRALPDDQVSQKPCDAEVDTTLKVKMRLWFLCQTRIRPQTLKAWPAKLGGEDDMGLKSRTGTGRELVEFNTSTYTHYTNDTASIALVAAEHYDPLMDLSSVSPEPASEQMLPATTGLLQPSEVYHPLEDEGLQLAHQWADSSEGDYFYADGQGNVYTLGTHAIQDADHAAEPEWPSTPQPISSDVNDGADVPWDDVTNAGYIMHHEVQGWPPVPGPHADPENAADQPWVLPASDDAPFGNWAE